MSKVRIIQAILESSFIDARFFYIFIKLDECGTTFAMQNAGKIVGGVVANAHSWPASALIVFDYKKDISINGVNITKSFSSMCGGSICFVYLFQNYFILTVLINKVH
jgi:hypothetical protein